jgi:apolipoprotein N-acyltransferase
VRLTTRLVSGAFSGALLVLSLPKPDLYFLSWIALLPLLVALHGVAGRREAALVGYASGLAFFGGSCYWIVTTMNTYGGLPAPLSVAVFALFVGIFGLHHALFALAVHSCLARWGASGLWLVPAIWVAVEVLQTHLLFGGFPWMLAGYALAPFGGLLQIAAWTGVYGLSFVLVAVNTVFARALLGRQPGWGLAGASIVALAFAVPAPADSPPPETGDLLRVRIVQTRIPIDFPWGGEPEQELLDELTALSEAGGSGPGLVVWPETPAPFSLEEGSEFRERIAGLAGRLDAHVLVGYIGFRESLPTNSAGLVSPGGAMVSRYDKIHLVPFGEYVPLGNLLFFAESMVRNVGDFAPGTEYTVSRLGGHAIAATICYEDVFPGLMRQFPLRGAEAIVNITNDGWFGSSSAPYQHLRMALVRAVGSRRYIVRAANTGVSAIIDPRGNIVARTELGARTVLEGTAAYRTDLTPYVRFGDVFAWSMTLVAAVALGFGVWPREKRTERT